MDGGSTATYVYCVVKSARLPARAAGRAPKGLSGTAKPRLLDAGDGYRLVVTSATLELYGAAAIDAKLRDLDWVGRRAAEHEAVVEHAVSLGTVVPMKLFTLFATDERAVAHIRKMKRSLDRVVERIEGCEEWGLRILFDATRAAARGGARIASDSRGEASSGRDFLLRKKALADERRTSEARATAEVEDLYERLAKVARHAHRRAAPSRDLAARVLLDAVFLVPKASVKKLKTTVASSAEQLVEDGFDLTLTGPWPAYSFIGGS